VAIPSFTERAKRGNRLSIRVTDPLDSETITYTFELQGFTAAYRRLEVNCPRGVEVYAEAVVEVKPEMLSAPAPEYPPLLLADGIEGQVLVQIVIDTMGRAEPNSLKIIRSPDPGFDEPVKNAVMGAQFRPGRVHGRPVRVLVAIPYNFSLKQATGPGTGGEEGHIFPPEPLGAILPPLEGVPQAVHGRPHRVTWWVAADGRVERVEVDPPIQDETYRRRFLARMRSHQFAPARTRDGRRVPGVVTITVKL
jgi:TonB family protein